VRENALYVPLQSVFAEDGEQWCHVQPPGKPPEKRKIKIGAANDNYTEVLDGLQDGEQVLLYNPLLPEGGTDAGKKKQPDDPQAPEPAKAAPVPATTAKAGT
jgi:hypothetical protein